MIDRYHLALSRGEFRARIENDWVPGIIPTHLVPQNRRSFHNATNSIRRVYEADMVKLLVRDRETIQEAVRRFRKLVERSGIKKEMRRREFYEKPSETNRRARLRAERRNKRTQLLAR